MDLENYLNHTGEAQNVVGRASRSVREHAERWLDSVTSLDFGNRWRNDVVITSITQAKVT